jgi:DNA-binding response OmpR family regulator
VRDLFGFIARLIWKSTIDLRYGHGLRAHCSTAWAAVYGKLCTGAAMNAKMKCILCVEDEPEMIDLIRLILGRRGFEVKGANGGIEGLKMIRQEPPDLILLDLMMPDMDGWEVYQQIKADEKTRNIPVIVVTAKAQSIDRVLGLHIAKVDDYISKPFQPQELLASVERVFQKKAA